ncbi:lim and transglutaminase domain protein ltd-1-like [Ylistrum balloti]|uniref:lim and transglutaminase domain protein ltd-1-like n=1 Tax=Ylistrum balloti TaxID=509963 RepID=UPI002905C3E4|nr:lim and transglutaminase domain protein ltd-1-like [Ylistrum balloti]
MGCGGSAVKPRGEDGGLLTETDTDPPDFPYIPNGYPPPKPSYSKKKNLFKEREFRKIDHKAYTAPDEVGNSFDELLKYLLEGLTTDLQRVRAIFCWIGCKNQNPPPNGPPDSPNFILLQVRRNSMSFCYLFARLCREANIPCVIIVGVAKAAGYEVGDSQDVVATQHNRWNGVYVDGEWRLVFPLWAFSAISGHSTGKYTLVERAAAREKEIQSSGVNVTQFNEYYFLPDPDEFVTLAMAIDPKWQFIHDTYDIKKFSDIAHVRPKYFNGDVKILTDNKACLHSKKGEISIGFKAINPKWCGVLSYLLFFNDHESVNPLPKDLQLERYIMMERRSSMWVFHARCPCVGVYKLSVTCGTDDGSFFRICNFKLICNEVKERNQPLPCQVGTAGWGPSKDTSKAGLSSPSQNKGTIHTSGGRNITFSFSVIKDISVRTELLQNGALENLRSSVSHDIDVNSKLNVAVKVPGAGEYALRIHTTDVKTTEETNACNYLISSDQDSQKKKKAENKLEKQAREAMKKATEGIDYVILTTAIDAFTQLDLEDKGDLTAAVNRHMLLQLRRDLRDAVLRRNVGVLEAAIEKAKTSEHEELLRPKIEEAEELLAHLAKLHKFAHGVLQLKQQTVSELHRYKIPPVPVHEVMLATYIMLGEPRENIKNWKSVQGVLGLLGKRGLINRVREFDTVHLMEDIIDEVEGLIKDFNEEMVCLRSPAAATFHTWLTNIVNDYRGNDKPQ